METKISKFRFYVQKAIFSLTILMACCTLVPFFLLIIEHLAWVSKDSGKNSLLNALIAQIVLKYEDA